MRFGSVCSGIEAASVAFGPLGWSAAWLAEIEPFPSAVLAHHYPDVPNLGDMTAIPRKVLSGDIEAPDMLCGGTPCQAFSIAGLRESLSDERGNLTLKFVEIADAIDHVRARRGEPPAVVLWENVPGVLSTKDNAFGCFLAGLAGEDDPLEPPGGRWANAGAVYGPARAIAWRTLDAQYFGLAQRRRRVFVVASAREGFDPARVLFEWDGVRRDSAPSRSAGESSAGGAAFSVALRGREGGGTAELGDDLQNCLRASSGGGDKPHVLVPLAFGGNNTAGPIDVATARNACASASASASGRMDFETETFLVQPTIVHGTQDPCVSTDTAFALGRNNGGENVLAFDTTQITSAENRSNPQPGDPCHPLAAVAHPPAIAFQERGRGDGVSLEIGGEVAYALTAPNGGGRAQERNILTPASQVRRLMPEECEALMGFPRGYTRIPWRNKPASQCPAGPRYKALGNSWAVPCVQWIGRRIQRHTEEIRRSA